MNLFAMDQGILLECIAFITKLLAKSKLKKTA